MSPAPFPPRPGSQSRWVGPAEHQVLLSPALVPPDPILSFPTPPDLGATKDMGKMLGGEEEKDPDAQKKEEERQEALRQQEEERKAKHARMEAEREKSGSRSETRSASPIRPRGRVRN